MYTFSWFVTSFIFAILDGVYRGLEKLYFIAFFNIFQHILKFLIGIPMILFGFTIFWAVSGFVLGGVIMSILSFSILWQYLKVWKYDISFAEELKTDFQSYKKDIIQNFILVILLSLLMNSDILLAKHFFSISDASIYITLSIIAKFLIFLGWAIEVVFYPIITKKSLKSLSKIDLWVPVILMSLMLIGAIGFFALIWPWFLDILKPGYGQYNTLFLQILFYCGVFMILSFYAKILIGFKKYILNMLLSLWIISLFFILFIWPVDMGDFIFSYIGVTSVLLTLTWGLLFYSLQKEEIKRYALIIASFVKKLWTSGE
jgi:O-antigen/teichoic acid export membrane protein